MTTRHLYVNDSPAGVAHDQTVRLCGSAEREAVQLEHLQIVRAAFGRPWRRWLPKVIAAIVVGFVLIASVDCWR